MSETRRLVVLDGARRFDLTVPAEATVAGVLDCVGVAPGAGLALHCAGAPTDPERRVGELDDGVMLTVADVHEPPVTDPAAGPVVDPDSQGSAPWWSLAALGVAVVVLAALHPHAPVWAGVALLLCALVAGLVAAGSRPVADPARAARVVGPGVLALAAVALLTQRTGFGVVQLTMFAGLVAVAVILIAVTVVEPAATTRAATGTGAVLVLVLAVPWVVALVVGQGPLFAAGVTAGAMPLVLRALPSMVLTVPDGHFLDFEHLMDTRWTVRGAVPRLIGTANAGQVTERVRAAWAARVSGTVLVCVIGAVALPFAMVPATEPIQRIGQIALAVCYPVAMALLARSGGGRPRWSGYPEVPRWSASWCWHRPLSPAGRCSRPPPDWWRPDWSWPG
ncbi:hypothetical protein [Cellulomonas denverensis]|uniref:hypothetical protein n=1 Tax=Cellulomonas denverensis TaxID=264297 RepID=UPI0035EC0AD4